MSGGGRLRLAVYCDYSYRREGNAVFAQLPIARFLEALRPHLERLVLVGRLDPQPGTYPFRLAADVELAPLPHYPSLSRPGEVLGGALGSLSAFWRALDGVDAVWLFGPHPLAFCFAALARLRGVRVTLGVRQDLPAYVHHRHPRAHALPLAARALELGFRCMARRHATIVVGPSLARNYRRARRLLTIWVSLVRDDDIALDGAARTRDYRGELTVLSVGRIDAEKNPLLLADVLARLRAHDGRWRLVVCGTGPMTEALAQRLASLDVADAAELRGYVPVDAGLGRIYRESHAFLHASFTEGMPQVLLEAFAAGLPVVATDVGGVAETVDGAALLIAPNDPQAAADQLERLARDPGLRERLVAAGVERVRDLTLESQVRRVVEFLGAKADQRPAGERV